MLPEHARGWIERMMAQSLFIVNGLSAAASSACNLKAARKAAADCRMAVPFRSVTPLFFIVGSTRVPAACHSYR
jgi:hypothetical protein